MHQPENKQKAVQVLGCFAVKGDEHQPSQSFVPYFGAKSAAGNPHHPKINPRKSALENPPDPRAIGVAPPDASHLRCSLDLEGADGFYPCGFPNGKQLSFQAAQRSGVFFRDYAAYGFPNGKRAL
ncbi:MAG: hypothetical protein JJU35_14430 [Balneolales bacterium]|nr:hypothetical protein [Balneolales bacterium]